MNRFRRRECNLPVSRLFPLRNLNAILQQFGTVAASGSLSASSET